MARRCPTGSTASARPGCRPGTSHGPWEAAARLAAHRGRTGRPGQLQALLGVGGVLHLVGRRVVVAVQEPGVHLDRAGEQAAPLDRDRPQLDTPPGAPGLPAGGHVGLEPLEGDDGHQRTGLPAAGPGLAGRDQPGRPSGVWDEMGEGHGRGQHGHQGEGGGGRGPPGVAGPAAQEPVVAAGFVGPAGRHPVQGVPEAVLDHRWFPLLSSIAGDPSSPRSRASPRWASDLTVPTGRPSSRATSASGRSWW
jgi:hypothetical protein